MSSNATGSHSSLAWPSDLHSGIALKELGYRRSDLIITTKLFWGTRRGPNDQGLSRKQCVSDLHTREHIALTILARVGSIIEGLRESLDRLQLDYVDVVFAHRPDPTGEPNRHEFQACSRLILL